MHYNIGMGWLFFTHRTRRQRGSNEFAPGPQWVFKGRDTVIGPSSNYHRSSCFPTIDQAISLKASTSSSLLLISGFHRLISFASKIFLSRGFSRWQCNTLTSKSGANSLACIAVRCFEKPLWGYDCGCTSARRCSSNLFFSGLSDSPTYRWPHPVHVMR